MLFSLFPLTKHSNHIYDSFFVWNKTKHNKEPPSNEPCQQSGSLYILDQKSASFCCERPKGKCFRLCGPLLNFFATPQFCHCKAKVVTNSDTQAKMRDPVPIQLHKHLQWSSFGLRAIVCLSLLQIIITNGASSKNCKGRLMVLARLMPTHVIFSTLRADAQQ